MPDFSLVRSISTLSRSFVQDLADTQDVFARELTVRRNLLYVLGITVLVGVLNWLFRGFLNSVFLGLIAVWTDSILLPIAIHCGTAGGKQSALLGFGIWFALCLWARAKRCMVRTWARISGQCG